MPARIVRFADFLKPNSTVSETVNEWTRRLWQSSVDCELFRSGEGLSGCDWFFRVFNTHSNEDLQKFCAILWFIWKERCNHMFNNHKLEEEIIPNAIVRISY
ncbi:unnamed protein product [Linum trigynum]|uniref:Aminotransferase-like plant mobile domain-containing protein n=1 Tax=Linum trigynum TaxID=586398 RepID=A0AAV2FK37_9ROSI